MNEQLISFMHQYETFAKNHLIDIKFDQEIYEWNTIKKVIEFYVTLDGGMCLVDFIDQANWDNVTSHSFNDNNQTLEIVWRDNTKVCDNEYDEDSRQVTIGFFGGISKIILYLSIDCICISKHKHIPTVLLKGHYKSEKDINRELNTKCSGFKYLQNRLFSKDVVKLVKRNVHQITVPIINCFTVSLLPKCAYHIGAIDSKNFLYTINIQNAERKIIETIKLITEIDDLNFEEIKNKGNQIRRQFENILKIFTLRHLKDYNFKDYDVSISENDEDIQKLMLGNLINVLKESKIENKGVMPIQEAVEVLNACSHSSGVRVTKSQLLLTSASIYLIVSNHSAWMSYQVS